MKISFAAHGSRGKQGTMMLLPLLLGMVLLIQIQQDSRLLKQAIKKNRSRLNQFVTKGHAWDVMIPVPVEVEKNTKHAACECRAEREIAIAVRDGKESDVGKPAVCDNAHAALASHPVSDGSAWTVSERSTSEIMGFVQRRG